MRQDNDPHHGSRLILLVAVLAVAWLIPTTAGAVTDSEELVRFGSRGTSAGQFSGPFGGPIRGMASDPTTGHLYVADTGNNRINEFTAWGDFVKAWGWGVADGESKFETCTTTCLAGIPGSGDGQLGAPISVAVDVSGAIYVYESDNGRVEKFDSSGQFALMFGGEVNKTTGGDVCTAASADECQIGSTGNGPGEFSESGLGLAISQTGTVLKGDAGRIEEFEPDGSFKSEFKTSGIVNGIAPDPKGSGLYVSFGGQNDVRRLSVSGAELGSLKVHGPGAITTDPAGNIYAIEEKGNVSTSEKEVVEFNLSGTEVSRCCAADPLPSDNSAEPERFSLTSITTNTTGDVYVASGFPQAPTFIDLYGPPPLKFGPPPFVAPEIAAQFPSSVDSTSATLKAQVNPNFWDDTRYYLEYGTEPCSSGSCTQQPAAPGAKLGPGAVKKAVTTSAVVLTGLSPHTIYYYRFVVQSGGGGPVRGVGGKVGADGVEGTFTTFASGGVFAPCVNNVFRVGVSASLPDCRAFEMVSPVSKSNSDVADLPDLTGFENKLHQVSSDGNSLAYSSYGAFAGPQGGPYISQYIARRSEQGWSSQSLGAPLIGRFFGEDYLENEFKGFSADLCHAWVTPGGGPTLAPGGVAGFPNLYRRDVCAGGYEALTTTQPPNLAPGIYHPEIQGFSADGGVSLFTAMDNLTDDAPPQPAACVSGSLLSCQRRLYASSNGHLTFVCHFPDGTSPKVESESSSCSAGSPGESFSPTPLGRTGTVSHAISNDGSRIYWSAFADSSSATTGRIYLRLNGSNTVGVSETQTTKPARFWAAAADGSKALFEVEDPGPLPLSAKNKNLYLYDLGSESSSLIAGKVLGIAAQSEDLSRVYFVSEEVLGGEGRAGKPNLYLWDEGVDTFVATLSGADAWAKDPFKLSDVVARPIYHVASATADGTRLAFISTEPLTGADNTDLVSGEADSEVFTYSAVDDKLSCASCSPAGTRPTGRSVQAAGNQGFLWVAASIPAGETQLYQPRALSDDGSKLFFTSYADLLPSDTNGKADVYEWERAGSGSCEGESDLDYYAANGGCLYLISSGESPSDSELVDTSPSGRDAFFTTNASLLLQDPGLIDVYDARAGGGFVPPQDPPAACEGEACQGPLSPPNDPTPGSSSFEGAGNLNEPKAAKKHKKKHKKKQRETKKKAHRATRHTGRAAR